MEGTRHLKLDFDFNSATVLARQVVSLSSGVDIQASMLGRSFRSVPGVSLCRIVLG